MNKLLLSSIIIALSIASFSGVFLYASIENLALQKKSVENESRFQCTQSSRYQTTEGDVTVWYPVKELYDACLKEKGL